MAKADLDLRGDKDWPDELVLEVLVARLANLGRPLTLARRDGGVSAAWRRSAASPAGCCGGRRRSCG